MTEMYQWIYRQRQQFPSSGGQKWTYHTQMRARGMAAVLAGGTRFFSTHDPDKYLVANGNTWSGWHLVQQLLRQSSYHPDKAFGLVWFCFFLLNALFVPSPFLWRFWLHSCQSTRTSNSQRKTPTISSLKQQVNWKVIFQIYCLLAR